MMDSSNGSKEMQANLCRSGCGFYGSAATEGMCSKCHKDYMRKKQNSPVPTLGSSNTTSANSSTQTPSTIAPDAALTAATTTATTATTVTSIAAANERVEAPEEDDCSNSSPIKSESQPQGGASSPTVSDSQDSSDGSEKGKKKRNRCHTCRKKVGLTGFECRCGGMYCSIHRYSDKHECSFDYRSHGQEEIRKNNPVVVGEKIQKL